MMADQQARDDMEASLSPPQAGDVEDEILWNPPWTFPQTGAQATYLPWQEEWLGLFLPLHPVWAQSLGEWEIGGEDLSGVAPVEGQLRDPLVKDTELGALGTTNRGPAHITLPEPEPPELFLKETSHRGT